MTQRKLAMPDVKTLAELFDRIAGDPADKPPADLWPSRNEYGDDGNCQIGPYCTVQDRSAYTALWVRAKKETLDAIKAHTINCGFRDTISFKIICWENGDALVLAEHNIIIGSVWLAKVKVEDVRATVARVKAA